MLTEEKTCLGYGTAVPDMLFRELESGQLVETLEGTARRVRARLLGCGIDTVKAYLNYFGAGDDLLFQAGSRGSVFLTDRVQAVYGLGAYDDWVHLTGLAGLLSLAAGDCIRPPVIHRKTGVISDKVAVAEIVYPLLVAIGAIEERNSPMGMVYCGRIVDTEELDRLIPGVDKLSSTRALLDFLFPGAYRVYEEKGQIRFALMEAPPKLCSVLSSALFRLSLGQTPSTLEAREIEEWLGVFSRMTGIRGSWYEALRGLLYGTVPKSIAYIQGSPAECKRLIDDLVFVSSSRIFAIDERPIPHNASGPVVLRLNGRRLLNDCPGGIQVVVAGQRPPSQIGQFPRIHPGSVKLALRFDDNPPFLEAPFPVVQAVARPPFGLQPSDPATAMCTRIYKDRDSEHLRWPKLLMKGAIVPFNYLHHRQFETFAQALFPTDVRNQKRFVSLLWNRGMCIPGVFH